ncbi:hypothetical protein M409DRAFT_26953 [Zasmidium cellare ATCC 36951]|uniref:Dolichyl-diphosphooligosaccharide--protein glycosyltransferase subunit 4 n=1 Tax=Zasmidium cellare ATCC 36951 TaxID=1080233 RepID=A0A6A6CB78_ZASCE|nr:uncharacterized protein M409DRAFT_26953 [Zasmidium cellare ATCC 36951]KAF2162716.1 hypothetical protein M409DRAFT_26953 [Zasmidium cellare ATCC 36951]
MPQARRAILRCQLSSTTVNSRNALQTPIVESNDLKPLNLPTSQKNHHPTIQTTPSSPKMISDASLYSLAVFLGAAAMLMIVLYHFLEVNSDEHQANTPTKPGPLKDNTPAGQIGSKS